MRKAAEYLEHAKECRELATLMTIPERREQLLKMADVWEGLARDRERRARAQAPAPRPN